LWCKYIKENKEQQLMIYVHLQFHNSI
jgi:hypothetical protein